MKDRIELVSPDSGKTECILAVCGCKTACVEIDEPPDWRVWFITNEEDAAAWMQKEMQSKQ